jgi:hypothetical protein
MGTTCIIQPPGVGHRPESVSNVMVRPESLSTWIPGPVLERIDVKRCKRVRFFDAKDREFTRSVGFATLRVAGRCTVDEVVFGEPGDPVVLGARSLTGLNLTVDARRKRLLAMGPRLAA